MSYDFDNPVVYDPSHEEEEIALLLEPYNIPENVLDKVLEIVHNLSLGNLYFD